MATKQELQEQLDDSEDRLARVRAILEEDDADDEDDDETFDEEEDE